MRRIVEQMNAMKNEMREGDRLACENYNLMLELMKQVYEDKKIIYCLETKCNA